MPELSKNPHTLTVGSQAVVINAVGPYTREASVPVIEACLNAKVHYVDLSDSREFVDEVLTDTELHARAQHQWVSAFLFSVSGFNCMRVQGDCGDFGSLHCACTVFCGCGRQC